MPDPYGALSFSPPSAAPPASPAAGSGPDPYGALAFSPPLSRGGPRDIGRAEAAGLGALDIATYSFDPVMRGLVGAGQDFGASGRETDEFPLSGAVDAARGAWHLAREKIDRLRGINPAGISGLVTGEKRGPATKAYEEARDAARQEHEQAFEQHPGYYVAGQLVGGLATPGFEARADTLASRIWAAAKTGAATGAVQGAGQAVSEGGGPVDAAIGAGQGSILGGALGAGLSGVTGAVGAGARKLGRVRRGAFDPDEQAARDIVGARDVDLAADARRAAAPPVRGRPPPAPSGVDPEAELAARKAGLPLYNVDYGGQATRDLARTSGNVSSDAWSALEAATRERAENRPNRISQTINRLFGGNLDAGADQLALQADSRRANAPAYARAYEAGDRPIWSPELERLTSTAPAIQDAMRSAVTTSQNRAAEMGFGGFNPGVTVTQDGRILFGQSRLGGVTRGAPVYPNIQYWDSVQRDLADMAERVQGREPDKARYLNSLHQQLNSELDRLVPEFQQARVGAWRFFRAQDASEAGRQFVRMDGDPREAARQLAQMPRADRELFARGFADELSQSVLKLPNSMNTIRRIFTSPQAAQKIRTALGAPRARELEALMRAEAIAQKSRDALGNSTTARQMEMLRSFRHSGLAHGGGGLAAGAGTLGLLEMAEEGHADVAHMLTFGLLAGLITKKAHKIDEGVMRRIGEMLASSDPVVMRRGVAAVAHSPTLMDALRRASTAPLRVTARDVAAYARNNAGSWIRSAAAAGNRYGIHPSYGVSRTINADTGLPRAFAAAATAYSSLMQHEEQAHHPAHPDNYDGAPPQ